jgi:hypothetical protein
MTVEKPERVEFHKLKLDPDFVPVHPSVEDQAVLRRLFKAEQFVRPPFVRVTVLLPVSTDAP